jgi:Cu(I)/Ag(I) efflux system membrane fusion protein
MKLPMNAIISFNMFLRKGLIKFLLMMALASCTNIPAGKEVKNGSNRDTFTCAMHPQIIRNEPGNCPICGMILVRKENASREVSQLDLSVLLRPTNSYVISQIPVTTIQKATKPIILEALGKVDYDSRYISIISARISGRIEKLYVKYRYEHIHTGEPIMDIYSPELATTQQELLFLVKNDPENQVLIRAAEQKLELLGLTDDQVKSIMQTGRVKHAITVYSNSTGHIHEALGMNPNSSPAQQEMPLTSLTEGLSIKEGMYVEKGQAVFQVNNTDKSWVILNLFSDQAPMVGVGTSVTLIPETAPGKKFQSRISFMEPFYRPGSRTITARVYFDNANLQIPVGSQVKATMEVLSGEADWLPRDAVLTLGLNHVVLLKQDNGFRVHSVQTGQLSANEVQIMNGLSVKDSVAANAQFLMDSESFIKTK